MNRKGFTLLEIIIIIAIILLVAALAIPAMVRGNDYKRPTEAAQNIVQTSRFEVIVNEDLGGMSFFHAYVIKDTQTGKSYLIVREADGVAVTALEESF